MAKRKDFSVENAYAYVDLFFNGRKPRSQALCSLLQSPALPEVLDLRWRLLELCKILIFSYFSRWICPSFSLMSDSCVSFLPSFGFFVLSLLSDVQKHTVESVQSNNVLPKIWKTQKLRCSYEVEGPAKQ